MGALPALGPPLTLSPHKPVLPRRPPPACPPWTQRSQSRVQEEGVWWFLQARPWSGPPHPPAASEQQGFLLEVVPLPEGQAVKLFHTHPKHVLELLGRQVSLQMKRETQSGAVSDLAKRPRRRGLQRGWGVSLGAPGSPASLCILGGRNCREDGGSLPGCAWLPSFPSLASATAPT